MLGGPGAPVRSVGSEGQFYFNTANGNVYGPKAFNAWPSPTTPIYPVPSTGCTTLNVLYNIEGSLGCMAGTSWDNTNRSLTLTGATVTTSKPILNLTQTWNNAGVDFTGALITITSTASSATSYPLRVRVGAVDIFTVRKDGVLTTTNSIAATAGDMFLTTGMLRFGASGTANIGSNGIARLRLGLADAAVPSAQSLEVQNASGTNVAGAATASLVGSLSTGSGLSGDIVLKTGGTGAGATALNTATTALTVKGATQTVIAAAQFVPGSGTKAEMDALTGVEGALFNVTDQLTVCPVKGAGFTSGGSITCLAHFEEGAWVSP